MGTAAITTDMNKAYDRVEWDFVEAVLRRLGFMDHWVVCIMRCITSVSFNVKVQGKTVESFNPGRGLRQGDPFSPYLFILVADVLSCMINEHVARGT